MSKIRANITWRPNIEQTTITASASSQASAAFDVSTYCIRLACVESTTTLLGIHFSIGVTPTATANSPYLPPGGVEYIAVQPGEKVAIIAEGAYTGNVTITELTH